MSDDQVAEKDWAEEGEEGELMREGAASEELGKRSNQFTRVLVAAVLFVMAVVGLICLFGGD